MFSILSVLVLCDGEDAAPCDLPASLNTTLTLENADTSPVVSASCDWDFVLPMLVVIRAGLLLFFFGGGGAGGVSPRVPIPQKLWEQSREEVAKEVLNSILANVGSGTTSSISNVVAGVGSSSITSTSHSISALSPGTEILKESVGLRGSLAFFSHPYMELIDILTTTGFFICAPLIYLAGYNRVFRRDGRRILHSYFFPTLHISHKPFWY